MSSKPAQKKFRQLLQEQMEPFELEDYLLERNCSLSGERGFPCSGAKLGSFKKLGKGFLELHKILRVSFRKLVSISEKQKTRDLDYNGLAFNVAGAKSCHRVAESEFSSYKSMAFGSLSGRNNQETSSSTRNEANSSISDISRASQPCNSKVMQEMKTGNPSPIRRRPKDNRFRNGVVTMKKKVPEDSILSATLWDLLLYSEASEKSSNVTAELQELVTSNSAPQLLISKGVLHQTKQLLFDCVREVVEKMNSLGEGREEANSYELLKSDYLNSVAEWRDLEPQKQLVGTEIGEIILKEITDEVVTELNGTL